jgi:hypothetical protein
MRDPRPPDPDPDPIPLPEPPLPTPSPEPPPTNPIPGPPILIRFRGVQRPALVDVRCALPPDHYATA